MTLIANETDSFPGARLVAVNPITAGECCKHATTQSLAAAVLAAGGAATFRAGKLFVDVSQATELDVCDGLEPVIASLESEPIVQFIANAAIGTDFSAVPSALWITDAATFEGSVVKVEQFPLGGSDVRFDFDPVMDGLPRVPTKVYVYVFNSCGRANVVGFETTIAV